MNVRKLGVRVLLSGLLIATTITSTLQTQTVSAAQINARKMTLLSGSTDSNGDGVNDGGSMPGGVVNHQFEFTVPTTASVGSIKFEYCTIASVEACVTPQGLVTTSATLGDENVAEGFTIVNSTNGAPYLTRSAAQITSGATVLYRLDGITNPDVTNTPNYTFFVRISTYASTNATGTPIDLGSVAAATSEQIILTGIMPESIIFCTGETIGLTTGNIPDCSNVTDGTIDFDQLFSPTDTATATSQMAASTNAGQGYVITVNGPTLTSGSNTIPAMTTSEAGSRGRSQFGMNLRANTTATSTNAVGTDVTPAANLGLNFRGQALTGYDTVDNFKYVSGEAVADSAAGGAGPTNSQIFTASYMVNVSGSQPAGTYSTTLTYICTASF